ncbi:uncharacterized protein MYCFIDRAFT_155868 [Pseudocercospora fijiensis CIRAD86]|uniref:Uncharacterized protein n=1 Tax=Pseudocercospora fijiensis (strain CIRAD86) TaxID=383855 RepID=M3A606_PSEFD|nr:uncharacterized protein MYCFIDRAFT_155868 [Pseudocercospora fijiensis CIRAD86]EME80051.1 hypothetical protein MYCFIDRAFT_155868 [Pseudocercospora fijiensis CIRAD86]
MANANTFKPFKIFTPNGILGYGYNEHEFWSAVDHPDPPAAIILDAGSTDPGPYLLGTGKTLCSRDSYIRDLKPILEACATRNIKFLVSSAGGAGTNSQVDFTLELITEVAVNNNWSFGVAAIKFQEDRDAILQNLRVGNIKPCSSAPPLCEHDVQNACCVVAQMGPEPFMNALSNPSVDIIVAGRSYDPAPFIAFCLHRGVEQATAWHVGKIIECGALCAVPKGRSIVATMYQDCFDLTPTEPSQRCTPVSVAAHTLYEKTRPDQLPGPGGVLHLDECTYQALPDQRTVRVRGSRFVPSEHYEIKLEGVEHIGYRTVYIGGIRDPILIANIDDFLVSVKAFTADAFPDMKEPGGPQIAFHLYGKNAVMGAWETEVHEVHEIGVLAEVVAATQHAADAVASYSRTMLLHGSYEGQLATAGNVAFPLTPLETPIGPVFKFSLYHLMKVSDPLKFFPAQILEVGAKGVTSPKTPVRRPVMPLRHTEAMEGTYEIFAKVNDLVAHTRSVLMLTCDLEVAAAPPRPGPLYIQDLAKVVRSKNSGPFEITLDILFASKQAFERVKKADVLTASTIRMLYNLQSADGIVILMFFEPALAWKCTFKRPWPQGSVGERDTFGAQLHAPLLSILVEDFDANGHLPSPPSSASS